MITRISILCVALCSILCGCGRSDSKAPKATNVTISESRNTETSITVQFKVGKSVTGYAYAIGSAEDQAVFEAGTIEGYTVVSEKGNKTVTFDDLIPDTEYTVFAQATTEDSTKGKVSTLVCRTKAAPSAEVTIKIIENSDAGLVATIKGDKNTVKFSYAIGSGSDLAAFEEGTIEGIETVDNTTEGTTETWNGLEAATRYTVFARGEDKYGKKGEVARFTITTHDPNAPADKARCVGYIPTWDFGCYNTMDWSALTHLNIAFYYPDSAGNMTNPFGSRSTLESIVTKAHENGVKVLASIRDCDSKLFSTEEERKSFVKKIIDHAVEFNLDGIDSDLEKSDAGFWSNYEPFILELRKQCNAEGLLLTTAVSTWFSNNITSKTFSCFDFVNIMAYDLGFANHSSFEGMKTMAEHYRDVRKIPADRIVIGVPFYGYNKTREDNDPEGWGDAKFYKELIAADPSASQRDETGLYVYNGMPTMERKSEFARNFGGIMIWQLAQDTTDEYSLLGVIKQTLFEEGTAPRPVYN